MVLCRIFMSNIRFCSKVLKTGRFTTKLFSFYVKNDLILGHTNVILMMYVKCIRAVLLGVLVSKKDGNLKNMKNTVFSVFSGACQNLAFYRGG